MGRLSLRQKSYKHKKLSSSSFFRLPQELITEIIARVATSSFTNFLKTKLICKDLHQLPPQEEDYIYRQVSLKNFPILPWKDTHSQFFRRCQDNKNPEALYRQGVVHYFRDAKLDSAIKCLEEATNAEHLGAHYAMGIIFIFYGGELKQKGISLLGGMKKSKILKKNVKDYRESLQDIIRTIWRNPLIAEERPSCCTLQHEKERGSWFIFESEDDEIKCEVCAADLEIESIYKCFKNGIFPI